MHTNINKINHLLNKDLSLLYISQFLKEISNAFVGIFIPIFLYKTIGLPLSLVLFVYSIQYFLYGTLNFFSFKFLPKIGVKTYIVIGTFLNALRFYFLYLGQTENPWWLIAFSITTLSYELLYFCAIRVDEIKFTDKENRGKETSIIKVALIIAGIIAPVLGGFFIEIFGFEFLFMIAGIGTILSMIPLFFTKDEKPEDHNFTIKSLTEYFKEKKLGKSFLVFITDGIRTMNLDILWPIYLYLLIPDFSKIGLITSGIIFLSIFFTIYIGYLVDKIGTEKLLKIASKTSFIGWFGKISLYFLTIISSLHIIVITGFFKFAEILLKFPMEITIFNKSEGKDILKYSYIEKFGRQIGRSISAIIIGILMIFVSVKFAIIFSFGIVALMTLTMPWVAKK